MQNPVNHGTFTISSGAGFLKHQQYDSHRSSGQNRTIDIHTSEKTAQIKVARLIFNDSGRGAHGRKIKSSQVEIASKPHI